MGVLMLVLANAVIATAQLEIGDNVKMNLNGNLGFNYTGSFGSGDIDSSHGTGVTGNADLVGYYFNPNFISWEFHPYWERQQSNVDSQSIARATGLGASVNIFGGSRFPGSVSFSKDFTSNSEFQFAGVPSIIGNSSGQSFGISWSALVPDYPQLHVNYSAGSSTSSIEGLSNDSQSSSRNFSASSNYQLAGFSLQGQLNHVSSQFKAVDFLTPGEISSGGSGTNYGVSAQHELPLHGGISMGWNHSSSSSDSGYEYSSNYYTVGAGFVPWKRLTVNQTMTYTSNLSAILSQSIVGIGGIKVLPNDTNSRSLNFGTNATFNVGHGLSINGYMNHRQQRLLGTDFSDTQYGGTLNYNYRSALFGLLYFGVGVVDTASKVGNEGAGIVANVGMTKRIGKWDVAADFNYQQNVQTLTILTTTSTYSYGASLRRKINRDTNWSLTYRGSRSALVTQDGDGNHSESYGASIGWRKCSLNGSYSQSTGTAVLTTNGTLTSNPLASLLGDELLFFNARSYSVSASTQLWRRLNLTGGYVNVFSDTRQGTLGNTNAGQRYNTRMEYRLRKFSIIGGFNRSMQDISTIGGPTRVVNSYYLSLTRWFNVF